MCQNKGKFVDHWTIFGAKLFSLIWKSQV